VHGWISKHHASTLAPDNAILLEAAACLRLEDLVQQLVGKLVLCEPLRSSAIDQDVSTIPPKISREYPIPNSMCFC